MNRLYLWLAAGGAALGGLVLAGNELRKRLLHSNSAKKHGISNEPVEPDDVARFNSLLAWAGPTLSWVASLDSRAYVSSGFRNEAVNTLVGGSSSSRHRRGLGMDISIGVGHNPGAYQALANEMRQSPLGGEAGRMLRTVIAEHDHLHFDWNDPLGKLESVPRETRWLKETQPKKYASL